MKSTTKLSLIITSLFFIITFYSCKKDVPAGKSAYVGEWISSDGYSTVTIGSDGSGDYDFDNGVSTKYIHGRVKFTSAGFDIKAMGLKQKFSVSQQPAEYSSNYSYYTYVAVFNGQNYFRY